MKDLKLRLRNELEITDLILNTTISNQLYVKILQRGTVWLNVGTADTLHTASSYVKTVQERQGILVSSIVEIAYRNG